MGSRAYKLLAIVFAIVALVMGVLFGQGQLHMIDPDVSILVIILSCASTAIASILAWRSKKRNVTDQR